MLIYCGWSIYLHFLWFVLLNCVQLNIPSLTLTIKPSTLAEVILFIFLIKVFRASYNYAGTFITSLLSTNILRKITDAKKIHLSNNKTGNFK
jgi:hypothetical protein